MRRILVGVVCMGLAAACPRPMVELSTSVMPFPPGVWTAWPPPFPFEEVGMVEAEGWTLDAALAEASRAAVDAGGVGVADVKWETSLAQLSAEQCATVPGCTGDNDTGEDAGAYPGDAVMWAVTGRIVRRLDASAQP